MTPVDRAPRFDSELAAVLASLPTGPTNITREMIPDIRQMLVTPPATVIGDRAIVYSDRVIPGPPGGPDLEVTIFERTTRQSGGPAVYYIHGGGMIIGDRWFGTGAVIDLGRRPRRHPDHGGVSVGAADGGDCELHVWPGGFHGFDMAAPTAKLSRAMMETRTKWLRRTLGR